MMDKLTDDIALHDFLHAIRDHYGYDFMEYSPSSLRRRIWNFMESQATFEITALQRALIANETLFELFVQSMSVTVTEMYRDPLFFKALRTIVVKRLATYPIIKIWLAGCATGEEAYSLAIVLKEEGLLNRSVLYATDINQKSLATASQGIYPLSAMALYADNYKEAGGQSSLSEYYLEKYDSVMFNAELKSKIVFAPHNLSADKSFNEFQLILCRNVLMYFNHDLQSRVVKLFYDSLVPFGFLGLGDKESLLFSSHDKHFEPLDKKQKLYMKM